MSNLYVYDDQIFADAFAPDDQASAHVEIFFAPGHAKAALAQLAQAVLDVLVEARKTDGPAA